MVLKSWYIPKKVPPTMIFINADGISYSGTLLLEEVPATVLLF